MYYTHIAYIYIYIYLIFAIYIYIYTVYIVNIYDMLKNTIKGTLMKWTKLFCAFRNSATQKLGGERSA